ncbi:hypothetical protein [Streptomyces caatingaensis]|uniref:hypothetical protein n=1 Tax=Streptomyces caatingaensis TaxID=1678637 RepID=UPI001F51B860|nr:hypothetical protein [Streptomyces caatingaensis]
MTSRPASLAGPAAQTTAYRTPRAGACRALAASVQKRPELFVPPPGGYAGHRVWGFPRDGRWNVLTDADDLRGALGAAAARLARRAAAPGR